MAHKTLIGETTYEISGGKTLVDGTAHEIKNGKTLVGETVYEVGFAEMVTITLSGIGYQSYAEYNGNRYTFPSSFEAEIGDEITLYCGQVPSSATVHYNGQQVASGLSSVTYTYTVKDNATISAKTSGLGTSARLDLYITEIPEGYAYVDITGSGNSNHYYVSIDGTKYISTTPLAVPIGTAIYCYVRFEENDSDYYGHIYLNGTKVASTTNPIPKVEEYYAEYNYSVNGITTIAFSSYNIYITQI